MWRSIGGEGVYASAMKIAGWWAYAFSVCELCSSVCVKRDRDGEERVLGFGTLGRQFQVHQEEQ